MNRRCGEPDGWRNRRLRRRSNPRLRTTGPTS